MKRSVSITLIVLMLLSSLCACAGTPREDEPEQNWQPERTMQLDYATEFAVDYYAGGYKLITLGDGSRFLVIPEGASLPDGLSPDVVPLYQPIENIYLAASAAMCLFDALDRLDAVRLSGTQEDAWYIENAKTAMQEGRILFAGKYSDPDYEMILDHGCPLAIESQMISHASDVKDKLEELGIAVLVDQSSNEGHPLGRTEWIKLYAALFNEEALAEELFQEQKAYLEQIATEDTGKTVAFFYINSSGDVVARKPGDYVSKMIELAGGAYVFDDLGDPESKSSTATIEMEAFFAAAKDADYMIYNSTLGGEVETLEDLIAKNELLAEMKAVQSGDVWCTSQSMYQETTHLGELIQSLHLIFSGEADDLDEILYLRRLP